MDFITHLPVSNGKTMVLVVVDTLTKYSHFIVLSHPYSATEVAKAFMDNMVKLHGFLTSIVSDRDAIFLSKFWQELF